MKCPILEWLSQNTRSLASCKWFALSLHDILVVLESCGFPTHHPLFSRFRPFRPNVPPGFEAWFFGVLVPDWIFTGTSKQLPGGAVSAGYPPLNGESFEWIGLMAAIVSARTRFTMVDIGAGWGRWLIAAAKLATQLGLPVHLVGV